MTTPCTGSDSLAGQMSTRSPCLTLSPQARAAGALVQVGTLRHEEGKPRTKVVPLGHSRGPTLSVPLEQELALW